MKKTVVYGVLLIFAAVLFVYASKSGIPLIMSAAGGKKQAASTASGAPSQPASNAAASSLQGDAQTEEERPAVEIPDEARSLMGVRTAKVSVKKLKKTIRTTGRIEYDERKTATVNTKFEGWIEKLYVDYTGRYVKKGEPLAEFYSPELLATQQEFLNALSWTKGANDGKKSGVSGMLSSDARSLAAASRNRLRLWDISDEQINKIADSGKPMRTISIYSPAAGYVTQKMAVQGMKVMPGEKLFDIADLSTVWITADIFEYELPFVREGQPATLRLSYLPEREIRAKIEYIYPSIAADTRTAKVRFTVSNPGGRLKPQMFTDVEIDIDMGARLSVPDEAVMDTGIRKVAYVDKGDGYFEPREVIAGVKADGMTEIIRGLKSGEKVAVGANFLIDSEAQLKGVKPLPDKKK